MEAAHCSKRKIGQILGFPLAEKTIYRDIAHTVTPDKKHVLRFKLQSGVKAGDWVAVSFMGTWNP
jgi:hypothetical protein